MHAVQLKLITKFLYFEISKYFAWYLSNIVTVDYIFCLQKCEWTFILFHCNVPSTLLDNFFLPFSIFKHVRDCVLFIITILEEARKWQFGISVVHAFSLYSMRFLVYIPLCKQNNVSPKQTLNLPLLTYRGGFKHSNKINRIIAMSVELQSSWVRVG